VAASYYAAMLKTLIITLIVSMTLLGCKKKDDSGSTDKGAGSSAAPPAPVVADAPPVEPAPPAVGSGSADQGSAAKPAVTATPVASNDDYKKRGTALLDKIVEVFKEKDCDKLAAAITSFVDSSQAEFDAVNAWEKSHEADKKALEKSNAAKKKKFLDSLNPTLERCQSNKALQDALAKMP
jgi:hypothetical protein